MSRADLARNLFLLAHDPFTGKLAISAELLGCGVVAAELADLVLARRLGVVDGRIVVTDAGELADGDGIDEFVLGTIARQSSTHTVRVWLESLGELVCGLVARDLVEAGVVRREEGRGLLRRGPDRFPAVDLLRASSPQVRLERMLSHPGEFDLAGAVAAAIVGGLGIERILGVDVDRRLFKELTDHLPTELQMVMAGVAAAAGAISLTVRR